MQNLVLGGFITLIDEVWDKTKEILHDPHYFAFNFVHFQISSSRHHQEGF